jgi:effector-binding domain-containing protein
MKSVLLVIVSIVVLVIVGLLIGAGLLKKVTIVEKDQAPITFIYDKYTGPYMNTGKIMMRLEKSLAADNITVTRSIGVYYDNPQKVASKDLRSVAGCVLDDKYSSMSADLAKKYSIAVFPGTKAIVAVHPYNSKMSILLGIFRVYPKLAKYMKEKGYNNQAPIMEIYDPAAKSIEYVVSLEDRAAFFDSLLK